MSHQDSSGTPGCRWPVLDQFIPESLRRYFTSMRLPQGPKPKNWSPPMLWILMSMSAFTISSSTYNPCILRGSHSLTRCLLLSRSQHWCSWLSQYDLYCCYISTVSSLPCHIDIGVFASLILSGSIIGRWRILQVFHLHRWCLVGRLLLPTVDFQ